MIFCTWCQEATFSNDLTYCKTEDTENLLNFHILHVVGDFQYNVSLIKSGKNQNSFEKNSIATNLTESTYSINRTLIN